MKIYFAINAKTMNVTSKQLEDFEVCTRSNWLLSQNTVVGPVVGLSFSEIFKSLEEANLFTNEIFICEAEINEREIVNCIRSSLVEDTDKIPVVITNVVRVSEPVSYERMKTTMELSFG